MMKLKNLLLLLILLFAIQAYTQISVAPKHKGNMVSFEKGVLERFKDTETIFILSSIYDIDEYKRILTDSWDVTPFRIVEFSSFYIEDYLSDKYSFVQLSGHTVTRTNYETGKSSTMVFTYVDFLMYDNDEILKKLNDLPEKKRSKNLSYILEANRINIARFHLYPELDFISTLAIKSSTSFIKALYTKDGFYNYKLGCLKNYFQKINNIVKNGETYWMYGDDFLPELRELNNKKLYIPSYTSIKYNRLRHNESEADDKNIHKNFKDYDYDYNIVSDEVLSNDIIDKKEFYYLRYVRVNSEQFVQVVNSITGEVVCRQYISGISVNLRPVHIKQLNQKILDASKQ